MGNHHFKRPFSLRRRTRYSIEEQILSKIEDDFIYRNLGRKPVRLPSFDIDDLLGTNETGEMKIEELILEINRMIVTNSWANSGVRKNSTFKENIAPSTNMEPTRDSTDEENSAGNGTNTASTKSTTSNRFETSTLSDTSKPTTVSNTKLELEFIDLLSDPKSNLISSDPKNELRFFAMSG
ncbi:hypothetical protein PSN45_003493 [Yamadazyma tenuis]|uniref:uncharacterized protein n=1 Tax=Candida tenuis TaxID=2315449 RepID=UPI0027A08D47|nr:hypothetical protein PSN45_003493 [Yamadazyma tenuis]